MKTRDFAVGRPVAPRTLNEARQPLIEAAAAGGIVLTPWSGRAALHYLSLRQAAYAVRQLGGAGYVNNALRYVARRSEMAQLTQAVEFDVGSKLITLKKIHKPKVGMFAIRAVIPIPDELQAEINNVREHLADGVPYGTDNFEISLVKGRLNQVRAMDAALKAAGVEMPSHITLLPVQSFQLSEH